MGPLGRLSDAMLGRSIHELVKDFLFWTVPWCQWFGAYISPHLIGHQSGHGIYLNIGYFVMP